MSFQHKDLAAGGWAKLSLVEQLANIGSEISRAIKARGDQQRFDNRPLSKLRFCRFFGSFEPIFNLNRRGNISSRI